MAIELKQRDLRVTVGGALKYYLPTPSQVLGTVAVGVQDLCQGFNGNREGANALSIYHITRELPFLYGKRYTSGGVLEREFIGYPIGNAASVVFDPRSTFGVPSTATLNNDAWEILAKTNPSRPHVSVPQVLGELRDLPKLVKGYGDGIIRGAARGNLSWRFGIAPMISDVRKLANFTQAANKRLADLRKLRDGKTLRRRCNLGTGLVDSGPTRMLIHSSGALLYAFRRLVTTYNKWGSAEWKLLPNSNLPNLSEADLTKFNNRVAAGFTTHGALETAWELVPWSWFVDWFSNVGDMIAATNNTVGCTWGRICVMRTSECRTTFDFDPTGSDTWPIFSGWYNCRFQRKERWPTSPIVPVPLPSLPILDNGQWSILLSLAALRR